MFDSECRSMSKKNIFRERNLDYLSMLLAIIVGISAAYVVIVGNLIFELCVTNM